MSVISQNQAGNSNQIPHLYQSIILGLIISKLKLTKVNVSLLLGHEVTDTITQGQVLEMLLHVISQLTLLQFN